MAEDCAYLVDASIYVFRGWFVLPDSLRAPDGQPLNAFYGYTDFLHQLLSRERPKHIVCCFDESLTSSCRNDIYPAYKANRESAPEELKRQFGLCREFTAALGISELASPRFEADDIIATLAERARAKGLRNVVVSADKDLTQVLRGADQWWDFARDKRLDPAGVEQQWGVAPEQIADLLALTGDKVDNVPGVPGVGTRTAARLLSRWGDLDSLFANLEAVASMKFRGAARVGALLQEHQAGVRLARRLTGALHADDLPAGGEVLRRRAPDHAALDGLFQRLGLGEQRRQRWQALLDRS